MSIVTLKAERTVSSAKGAAAETKNKLFIIFRWFVAEYVTDCHFCGALS